MAFLVCVEVFPLVNREIGMSCGVGILPHSSLIGAELLPRSSSISWLRRFFQFLRQSLPMVYMMLASSDSLRKYRPTQRLDLTNEKTSSGLNVLCLVVCFVFVPDTQEIFLEKITEQRKSQASGSS